MQIISHRGYWKSEDEKNTLVSFERSFSLGFGTETDIRDQNGKLVISHDPPLGECMSLFEFLSLFDSINPNLPLALNIKSDGLLPFVKRELDCFPRILNYYFFDMAVPDSMGYINNQMPVLTRRSEYEGSSMLDAKSAGIWLDCFHSLWYDNKFLQSLLLTTKKVFIVSEDLHGRNPDSHWSQLKKWNVHKSDNIIICTDYPETCNTYFNNEN
jgi:glycerophosphoryl diester phosphodiesterase